MSCLSRKAQLQPVYALMAGKGTVVGGFSDDHCARFRQGSLLGKPARTVTSGFLARCQDDGDAALGRGRIAAGKQQGCNRTLHVAGASAVEPIAFNLARKGRHPPFALSGGYGIEMPAEAQR